MRQVAVVDYGTGNLDSVVRALQECGARAATTARDADLAAADAVVIPGVGAFGRGMALLRERGLVETLEEHVRRPGIPVLGLCLGMQLLASRGEEGGEAEGLGWIDAQVRRLEPAAGERIPHVGWNELEVQRESPLLEGIASGTDFYFVHSFGLACADPGDVLA